MSRGRGSWGAAAAAAALAVAAPDLASGEGPPVFGSIPGRVAARVSVQMSEDEPDIEIGKGAVRAVEESGRFIALDLDGGGRYLLPVPAGRAPALADRLRQALGQVVHLEYHPQLPTAPRQVRASWTLSSVPELLGEGPVPLGPELFRTILRLASDPLPRTGVFAPIVQARARLDELLDHVSNENGRRTDELADAFVAAVDETGLHLGYFKTHGGEPVTEEFLQGLRDRGIVRSAEQYWTAAARRLRQGQPVNAILDQFEAEWKRCPPGAVVEVSLPGQSRGPVTESVLREMRRLSVQGLLDRAALAAEARDVDRTRSGIDAFRREVDAANATAQRFAATDFQIDGEPATPEKLDWLVRKAKGETGFWGSLRALWRRVFGGEDTASLTTPSTSDARTSRTNAPRTRG